MRARGAAFAVPAMVGGLWVQAQRAAHAPLPQFDDQDLTGYYGGGGGRVGTHPAPRIAVVGDSTFTGPGLESARDIFVAQAAEATTGQHMGIGQQITMMLALMVTSKGVAAVPRSSAVVLLATLNTFLPAGLGPIGVAVIFGIDELMDMGRSAVNLMGNCLATIVVARWEGDFDDKRARVFGTPEEAELDLKSGDIAFAEAVRQGD